MRTILLLLILFPCFCIGQKFATNNTSEYTFESSVKKIGELYNHLKKEPEDFGKLATEWSQEYGSFNNSGILAHKMLLESFDDAFRYYISQLKIREISKPFETIFGWHIARVLSISKDNKYEVQHILIQYE